MFNFLKIAIINLFLAMIFVSKSFATEKCFIKSSVEIIQDEANVTAALGLLHCQTEKDLTSCKADRDGVHYSSFSSNAVKIIGFLVLEDGRNARDDKVFYSLTSRILNVIKSKEHDLLGRDFVGEMLENLTDRQEFSTSTDDKNCLLSMRRERAGSVLMVMVSAEDNAR